MSLEHSESEVPRVDPKEALIKPVSLDTTLVGVYHGTDIDALATPQDLFKGLVSNADHLILEAPRFIFEDRLEDVQAGIEPIDYEVFAFKNFLDREKSDNIRFLEEDSDSVAIVNKYGLTSKNYILGSTLPFVHQMSETYKDDPETLARRLQIMAENLHSSSQTLDALELSEVLGWIQGLSAIEQKHKTDPKGHYFRRIRGYMKELMWLDSMAEAADLVHNYHVQVRDYEVIGPNVKAFADAMPGKKLIIVGRDHVPNVERVLQGEEIHKPPQWPEFVRSRGRKARQAAAALESIPITPRRAE